MDLMELVKKPSEESTDDPIISLKFSSFRSICPYNGIAAIDGMWDYSCNEKSTIPIGHSWGICNPDNCPFLKV